ncbi:hypothetical protein Tco_1257466 [Tanacetum coccineum]
MPVSQTETPLIREKGRLEAVEASLRQKVEAVKCDRAEVVSKVVPYVAIELVHSDEMDMLVGKLVSSAIFYHTYAAFEEKEDTKAGNDVAIGTFPFLSEVVVDPSASLEALLSKKLKSLCRQTPTKTHAPSSPAPS